MNIEINLITRHKHFSKDFDLKKQHYKLMLKEKKGGEINLI